MSLATELLEQADMLVKREPKNPKQASLRRAVSAAYYALFHLLAEDAARLFAGLCGRHDAGTVSRVTRTFAHLDLKKVSEGFGRSELPNAFRTAEKYETPSDLKSVADAFGSLYQARQEADYNTGEPVTRPEALKQIEQAKQAFAAWERVKGTDDARTYLACFSLWDKWNIKR
jgi:uncharacterized protein (UPF0332 family)